MFDEVSRRRRGSSRNSPCHNLASTCFAFAKKEVFLVKLMQILQNKKKTLESMFFMLFHALQVNLGFVDQRRSASAFRRFIVSAKLLYVSQLLTS